jgi:hypothetical protein
MVPQIIEAGYGRHDRVTKGGRRLWYDLRVIQQPERARACGSGPKSSADRRPVDPPPVVELHVYEGEDWNQRKDITFNYNANFFLYATLEHARVMAHGRVQAPAANTPPVLSGMPVSGMAYLDRPSEAGYFLFPDLSVRHEGRYRLNFSLYEETKEECDMDVPRDQENEFPCGAFDWRMEIQSVDFSVYSAKKFPGLTESTALSRTVAEQGCRVRIRRDVRMRRRDGKPGGDYENSSSNNNNTNNNISINNSVVEEDFARRRTQTPESLMRSRSLSNPGDRTPYAADGQRRSSGVEYPPPPMAAQASAGFPPYGHPQGAHHPQYPGQQPIQASPVPPSPSYSTGSYPPTSSYPPPPQAYNYPEGPPSPPARSAMLDGSSLQFRRATDWGSRRPSLQAAPAPRVPRSSPERSPVTLPALSSLMGVPANGAPAEPREPSPRGDSTQHPLKQLLERGNVKPSMQMVSLLNPAQGDPRGTKRQRDDREPGRLVNGARQPDDTAPGVPVDVLPFKRASGVVSYAQSREQRSDE